MYQSYLDEYFKFCSNDMTTVCSVDTDCTAPATCVKKGASDGARSDKSKDDNSLVVILCAVGGAVLVVALVILAMIMRRKPPVREYLVPAGTLEMMEAPPPLVPMPQGDPYGYVDAGGFAAEEEEVAPAEAVLAAEPSPPAQSWAPELEQELEPEC